MPFCDCPSEWPYQSIPPFVIVSVQHGARLSCMRTWRMFPNHQRQHDCWFPFNQVGLILSMASSLYVRGKDSGFFWIVEEVVGGIERILGDGEWVESAIELGEISWMLS